MAIEPANPASVGGDSVANHPFRFRRRWLFRSAGVLAAALAVAGFAWWFGHRNEQPTPPADPFPIPPISSSPFRNTRSEVGFVGSEACRGCHGSHALSYGRTGMGRSLADLDPAREPPDGAFDHAKSKRRYEIRRKDGQMWHRELLLTEGPEEVLLAEYPIKYLIGSGNHSRSYLVEAEGFLVESPVTWYTDKKMWAMSPGYDRPSQQGFERPVGESCLICHVGQAEALGGSMHRMRITEAVIGCERCHGPGALHVERHHGRQPASDPRGAGIDDTIVNPVHLSRELAEAICQQCHLRVSASVLARGRKFADFRPGLPLQDFRHDYRLETAESTMTVVGHVDQMHLSRCYQGSAKFSCLTCHDPHHEPRPKERVEYYRSVCLTCHAAERCKVNPERRHKESPGNHCVQCHMPMSATEIPHLALTHHKVGVHDKAPPAETDPDRAQHGFGVLKPFLDLNAVGEIDRQRSLGMAYVEVANRQKDESLAELYRGKALNLLMEVRAAGLRDGAMEATLARLRFDMELEGVAPLAEGALTHADLDGQDRAHALFLIADAHYREGRRREAIPVLLELNGVRRHSVQWQLLADCEFAVGNVTGGVQALEGAARCNPRLDRIHQHLADYYRRQGNAEKAAYYQRRAVP
jgi:predicted CXXCH cytochrome family protein